MVCFTTCFGAVPFFLGDVFSCIPASVRRKLRSAPAQVHTNSHANTQHIPFKNRLLSVYFRADKHMSFLCDSWVVQHRLPIERAFRTYSFSIRKYLLGVWELYALCIFILCKTCFLLRNSANRCTFAGGYNV